MSKENINDEASDRQLASNYLILLKILSQILLEIQNNEQKCADI